MSAVREKDQADFDLEAFIDLFDEAITSDDPSVQKTLQHLMVIAALARNHDKHDKRNGPLRRLFDDIQTLNHRLHNVENAQRSVQQPWQNPGYNPAPMPIWTAPMSPTTGTQFNWPPSPGTYPPGTIFASKSVTPPNSGAHSTAQSTTSYAWDPQNAGQAIAERAEDLLKNNKYKGSTLKAVDVKTS